jgi:hypothetical protein
MQDPNKETLAERLAEHPLSAYVQEIILTRLTPTEQAVFLLELDGLGIQRTSTVMGWGSPSTARALRQRAWAKIGRALVYESLGLSERSC